MTWTAPQIARSDPLPIGDERPMLDSWLDHQRQTLLLKCAGLTGEQLALRSVEPSTLSLLGLVRHMAEVERSWFRRVVAGESVGWLYCDDANPDGDFDRAEAAGVEADFAAYAAEVALARAAAAARSLEEEFPHRRRAGRLSLRWVYVHMIEEYARHNGHADLIRERIDGTTGS